MAYGSKAIVIFDKKILLLLRDDKPDIPEPDRWSLPGGGMEEGEDFKDTLNRELEEEINIVPKDIRYIGKYKTVRGNIIAIYFSKLNTEESSKLKLGDEGQAITFFSFEELKNLKLTRDLEYFFTHHTKEIQHLIENGVLTEEQPLGLKNF